MFFVKVFWVSLPLLIIITFMALGVYGIPALQVPTQKVVSFKQGD